MLFKKHYPELDFVRAAAIILVLMLHLNESLFRLPENSYLTRFFAWGYNGVDLFFVLSGFLIGGQIIEENLKGAFSFKRFYIKRFWRIVPPFYFAILVYIASASLLSHDFILKQDRVLKDTLFHLAYLQDYFHPVIYGGIYWTLAVEEQFYILIPVLLYLFIRYLRRYFLIILISLILIGVSIRFALYDPSGNWWYDYYMPFHTRFDSLLYGVLAAFFFIFYKDKLAGLSRKWKVFILLMPVACLLIDFLYGDRETDFFDVCWQFTLAGLGFSALILLLTSSSLGRYLPLKKMTGLVARLSYTMYLYHILIMILLTNFVFAKYFSIDNTSFMNYFIVFIIYFLTVFLFSGLIYLFVDRPCMKVRSKIIERHASTRPESASV